MTEWFLRYKPQKGYLHHWLVGGPQLIPISDRPSGELNSPLDWQAIAAHFWRADSLIEDDPCERAKFTPAETPEGAVPLTWRYYRCEHDHLVDLAGDYPGQHYLRAWAYTELVSSVAQPVSFTLHAFAPAQLWLNGEMIARQESFAMPLPSRRAAGNLIKGANRILVRMEQVAGGAVPYAIALQVGTAGQQRLEIRLPTLNPKVEKHHTIERLAQRAYIEHDLYAGAEAIFVKWPVSIRTKQPLMLRVQRATGQIVGEAQPVVSGGFSQHLLEANWAKDGRYQVKILPELEEHARGMRVGQELDVNILHSNHVDEPQGDQAARAIEFLKHAAWWTDGLYAEMASMALGLWKQVNGKELLRIMDRVLARQEGSEQTLAGLLLMAYRYAPDSSMPPLLAQRLEECIVGYDYETGADGDVGAQGLDDDSAIVRHACLVLAGQLYQARSFVHNNQLGSRHQEVGEQRALAWIARRGQGGFAAWDSGEGSTAMLLGLLALVDYAESESLSELAAATLDKLLFSLALNSWRGIFGSTHGATSAASITDARMEPTSPITRLLWGVGCWNQHTAACFALATSQSYGCPPIHERIALDRPAALWSRERHMTAWRDAAQGPVASQETNQEISREINKVTYKTPDYMLASAQDYQPGMAGGAEHLWQATMSPSAVVFVNHPRCTNQKDAYRPNFWRGNGVLPRVAQWRDLLVAIYKLPAGDWLGYTHAHFPLAAFDQHALKRGWAFARKGDAYLALTTSLGMKLIKSGPGAYRELRSVGEQNIWLCQMGRAAQDGTFADFQRAILARPLLFDGLNVTFTSLRGETIAFGWEGPLLVEGKAQPLDDFPHYESPYCTCALGDTEMEIHYDDWLLRLNFDIPADTETSIETESSAEIVSETQHNS